MLSYLTIVDWDEIAVNHLFAHEECSWGTWENILYITLKWIIWSCDDLPSRRWLRMDILATVTVATSSQVLLRYSALMRPISKLSTRMSSPTALLDSCQWSNDIPIWAHMITMPPGHTWMLSLTLPSSTFNNSSTLVGTGRWLSDVSLVIFHVTLYGMHKITYSRKIWRGI